MSGLLYGALFPPIAAGWLSWIALVPVALALRASRSLASAVGLAAFFSWVATASVIPWVAVTLHDHFDKTWAFSIAFWLMFSAGALAPYYSVLLGVQAWAAKRSSALLAPFLFAAAWTGAEWVRVQLGFRSPWTRLGDAHVDAVWLRQIADLVGVYGISFLVALANAVVAEAVVLVREQVRGALFVRWQPVACGASAFLLLTASALAYGQSRIASYPSGGSGFEVALVQGNMDPQARWKRSTAGRVFRRYGRMTRDAVSSSGLGGTPPDLVVWPENSIQTAIDDPAYARALLGLASRAPLLLGAPRAIRTADGRKSFNSAFLIDENGVQGHYDKRRLLPFSETHPLGRFGRFGERGDLDASEYTAGTSAALFAVGDRSVAPLICMEALYPELAREAVRGGATLLVNLSNDAWFSGRGGAEQHLSMVRFRAIETRRSLVRSTTNGISALITPTGEIAAHLGSGEQGILRAELPEARSAISLYARIGDVFAVACLVGVALASSHAVRLTRMRRLLVAREVARG